MQLRPGVWLRWVQTEKFKSSFLSLNLMAPLKEETAAANALLPSVLRRGSVGHPDMQRITAALDNLYGGMIEPVVRKKGETQCVGFVTSFLDDAFTPDRSKTLEPMAALLGELLLHPVLERGVFSAEYVTGELENLQSRIAAQINDKRRYAMQRLAAVMCEGEAFGVDRLGSAESAAAITPEGLWRRYRELLCECEIELFYCGSAPLERVCQALNCALKDLPEGNDRTQPDCEVRLHAPREPRLAEEAMNVTQGKLAMGFRTGGVTVWEQEYPALLMLNAIFGGTTMSKLFMNVREKLSLCYYASSMLEKMKGLLMVSSGIEFEKYRQARDEILRQLEAVRQGEIEPGELEGARRIVISALMTTLDAQDQMEEFWLGQAAAGLDTGIDWLARQLEAVTKEQVVKVAHSMELDTIYFLKGQEG